MVFRTILTKFDRSLTDQLVPIHADLQASASSIVHFIVVCLVAKPLDRNEAKGDLVMMQTLLLFKCKLLCYHANWILVSITTRSPSASLQIKGLATKHTTVKWPIQMSLTLFTLQYACSLNCSPYISWRASKETLFKNQKLLYLVIISSIHVTLMFYPGIIL